MMKINNPAIDLILEVADSIAGRRPQFLIPKDKLNQ